MHAAQERTQATLVLVGACLGLCGAAIVAWGWTRWGRRLNMGAILKVTALFLGLFLLQLLIYGVHELAESGVIQGSQAFHDATEIFGPDGKSATSLSYSLLLAPLLYLLWARRDARPRPPARPAAARTARATGRGNRAARRTPRPRRCRPRSSGPPRPRRWLRPHAAPSVMSAARRPGGGAWRQTTTVSM